MKVIENIELLKKLYPHLKDVETEYKYINWYNKKYIITSYWDIISLKRKNPKILKPLNNWRYFQIDLYKTVWGNVERKRMSIHRLVWMYFIIKEYNKNYINHIDWNWFNNNVQNLEWCTPSENILHAHDNWLITKSNKKVIQLNLDWKFIAIRNSFKEAEEITWAKRQDIRKCILWIGGRKTAWGFKWKEFSTSNRRNARLFSW